MPRQDKNFRGVSDSPGRTKRRVFWSLDALQRRFEPFEVSLSGFLTQRRPLRNELTDSFNKITENGDFQDAKQEFNGSESHNLAFNC
jgi:hypothetical protein